jgi:guanylate kinase
MISGMQRGLFVILIGPGGVGKDTLLNRLVAEDSNFTPIVSYTTRAPRPGEVDGVAYHFVPLPVFARMAGLIDAPTAAGHARDAGTPEGAAFETSVKRVLDAAIPTHSFGDFLEFVNFRGQYYGSSRVEVESLRESGRDVVIVMDTHGGDMMMEMGLDPTTVFVMPPSLEVLRERASARGFEDESVLEGRMAKAAEEIAGSDRYHYLVVNDTLENAMSALHELVVRERSLAAAALSAPALA